MNSSVFLWCVFLALLALIVAGGRVAAHSAGGSSSEKTTRLARITDFAKWLGDAGSQVRFVSIEDFETYHGGYGLVATQDIPKGTTVVSVPYNLVMNVRHAFISEVSYMFNELGAPEFDTMALFLWYEMKKTDSLWRPYLLTLPTFVSTPLYWEDKDLKVMVGSNVLRMVHMRKSEVKKGYEQLSPLIFKHFPEVFKDESQFSLENFQHVLSLLWSRMMSISIRTNDEEITANALVPFVDFFNTGYPEEWNVDCRSSAEEKLVECYTTKDVIAGTELLRPYRRTNFPNSMMLLDYGLALEYNYDDRVEVPFVIGNLITTDYDTIVGVMEEYIDRDIFSMFEQETKSAGIIPLAWKDEIYKYRGIMSYFRILKLNEEEIDQIGDRDSPIIKKINKGEPVNKRNEKAVVGHIIKLLDDRLKLYPTTLAQDEDRLDKLHATPRELDPFNIERPVLSVMVAEKRLIEFHKDLLKDYLKKRFPNNLKGRSKKVGSEGEYDINPEWNYNTGSIKVEL